MNKKLLCFEDNEAFRRQLIATLIEAQFSVDAYGTEEDVKKAISDPRCVAPHAAILDIRNRSGVEVGFDLCRAIQRRWARTAVIFLTDCHYSSDAHKKSRDYVADYFDKSDRDVLKDVVKRLNLWLGINKNVYSLGNLSLDRVTLEMTWRNEQVLLDLIPASIVKYLADHPGRFRSAAEICEALDLRVTSRAANEARAFRMQRKKAEQIAVQEAKRAKNLISSYVGKVRRIFQCIEDAWATSHNVESIKMENVLRVEDDRGYAWIRH
jgi:DNA-binding response OmpR family regulator